jgi:hypothetical protein
MNPTDLSTSSVTLSDLGVNVLFVGFIVVKSELYKCVAPIAGKETDEIMCPEDPPCTDVYICKGRNCWEEHVQEVREVRENENMI